MDLSIFRNLARPRTTSSPRRLAVSEVARELFESPSARLKLQFLTFLVLTFAVGFAAYERSLTIARDQWLTDHPPSLRTWVTFIESRGFREVTLTELKEELIQAAPYVMRGEERIWLDAEESTLALSRPEGFLFFTRERAPKSNFSKKWNWETLGRSWEAIEALQARPVYGEIGGPMQAAPVPTVKDPKRLHY